MTLPCSPACDRNKGPILDVLRDVLDGDERVLELGAGTGQHAVHFAAAMPGLRWLPTDLPPALEVIRARIEAAAVAGVEAPRALDVTRRSDWPAGPFGAAFTANTFHIVDEAAGQAMAAGVARILAPGAPWLVYGPFNRDGAFTSEGNQSLDAWARATFPGGGLRDHDEVVAWHGAHGLILEAEREMPANNRLLLFRSAP